MRKITVELEPRDALYLAALAHDAAQSYTYPGHDGKRSKSKDRLTVFQRAKEDCAHEPEDLKDVEHYARIAEAIVAGRRRPKFARRSKVKVGLRLVDRGGPTKILAQHRQKLTWST